MITTFGLDLGTNSIGWSLLGHDAKGIPDRILAAGVRIFSAGVDDKTKTPLSFERRTKRLLRRQISRRRQRRDRVRNLLITLGFLPKDILVVTTQEGLWNRLGDPYALRAKGLDQALTAHEFGRVLMHLQRHRGFLSNRRADRGAKQEDEATQTDVEIANLRPRMQQDGARTLGEWLHRQPKQRNTGARWLWTERSMLREEFAALCAAQMAHHPILTDDRYGELHEAIFWQRPLKSQAGTKGGCALEPAKQVPAKAGSRRKDGSVRLEVESIAVPVPRAAMAWQEAQRARYWQDLNHLALRHPRTGQYEPITHREREAVARELEVKASLSWKQVRKIIGRIRSGSETLTDGETFNLEDGGKDKLIGNRTATRLRDELAGTPISWDALPPGDPASQTAGEKSQASLLKDLLTIDDPVALTKRLTNFWRLGDLDAQQVAKIRLEEIPGRLSLKALKKILPFLTAGKNYHDACQLAGYRRRDQQVHVSEDRLGPPPEVRNPVVAKCLHEVRKVINSLIRVHGLPTHIRVEMARDLKLSPSQRDEVQKANKKLERINAEAITWWREWGVEQPSHDDRMKYRLWKQQGEMSAYSDRPISQAQLRSGVVQVDHILPYSRSFDDSFGNKAICFADENADKGNRTSWEWLGGDTARWDAFMLRLRSWRNLSIGARRRFTLQKLEIDDFMARQLNDTRYLSRAVLAYLGCLYPSHRLNPEGEARFHYPVQVTAGKATAGLRHFWGLNSLLSEDGAKNRADHRHHAVDAVVIACTDRQLYRRISAEIQHSNRRPLEVDPPWSTLRTDLMSVLGRIVVSHVQDHRLSGALHEDTAYGLVPGEPDKKGMRTFRYRVSLEKAAGKPAMIRDTAVRALIETRLAACGNDPKKAFPPGFELTHRDGKTPIRTVRVDKKLNIDSVCGLPGHAPVRWHLFKNNHHAEIIRNHQGKYRDRVVTTMRAARLMRQARVSAYGQDIGTGDAIVLSLHVGDMVEIHDGDRICIARVKSLSEGDYEFQEHHRGGAAKEAISIRMKSAKKVAETVHRLTVDPIGRVSRHADPGRRDRKPRATAPG